jgi:hypothetical protein
MRGLFLFFLFLFSVSFSFFDIADDIEVFGLELEKLLNLASGVLSAALMTLTIMAYQKTGNKRLLFVSAAFFLFAIKGFMTGSELFFGELPSVVDPVASFLDFAILLSFFAGILGK